MMISCAKSLTVMPTVWIRTAASPKIGFGHLRRTIVLAQMMREFCKPLFLLDKEDRWSVELLRIQNFDCFNGEFESAWSLFPDPSIILIDTRISEGLESLIFAANVRTIPIISIHDLGLIPLPSNIVIDGSIAPKPADVAFTGQTRFTGPDFMVLDSVYQTLHEQRRPIEESIQSVFINLGGGESRKYFLRILNGLRRWNHEVEVIGVPGFASWGQEELGQKDWKPLRFRWESQNIERFLVQSDLAITAGGIAAYEALCAGTPLLALAYDDLQKITVQALASSGACVDLGQGDALNPAELVKMLSAIDADVSRRKRLSRRGRQIVDGHGAGRVAEIIRQTVRRDFAALGRRI